jgi:hypothetical protein
MTEGHGPVRPPRGPPHRRPGLSAQRAADVTDGTANTS